jgi:hypothetical protein
MSIVIITVFSLTVFLWPWLSIKGDAFPDELISNSAFAKDKSSAAIKERTVMIWPLSINVTNVYENESLGYLSQM